MKHIKYIGNPRKIFKIQIVKSELGNKFAIWLTYWRFGNYYTHLFIFYKKSKN